MATSKTYKSNSRNLTIFLTIKGRVRSIHFSDLGATYNYSILTTSDPNVQAALERNPKFGQAYTLFDEESITTTADQPVVEQEQKPVDASYPKVTRVQTAAQILEEKYGIDPTTISSKTDVLKHAKSLNIEFPNLK